MRSGFSLVELSIVLVILGLLVGGVLSGQALIRASELRSITTDVNRYIAATQSFRDKYFALPGDMPNAVRFWGAQAGSTADGKDATCAALSTAATGTPTCNGDGNGIIGENSGTCYERYRYWQHLANAGLIEGQYSGITAAGFSCEATLNSPANSARSRITGAGFSVAGKKAMVTGDSTIFDGYYGNRFEFGKELFFGTGLWAGVLKAEEAWNIDTKMDDGQAALGKVTTYKKFGGTGSCASSDATTATYDFTTSNLCALQFEAF